MTGWKGHRRRSTCHTPSAELQAWLPTTTSTGGWRRWPPANTASSRAIRPAWPGRAGESRLRAALDLWQGPILPDSPPEARLRRQLVQWGYAEPQLQVPVVDDAGVTLGRVDVGWPAVRVGLEYDSQEFHGPSRWASDEARQVAIERLGWRLMRVDKLDLRPGRPELRTALARAWSQAAAA